MPNPEATIIAAARAQFTRQYTIARRGLRAATESDNYWGDSTATLSAAVHTKRAAELAVILIALRKALV